MNLEYIVLLQAWFVIYGVLADEDILKNPFNDINHAVPEAETLLDIEDFKRADEIVLPDDKDFIGTAPWLSEDKFEGDIDGINPASIDEEGLQRNAIRSYQMRWPNAKVPYAISTQYGPQSRALIAAGMQEFATKTCIRFIPRSNEYDYIYIMPGQGCYSMVGRTGGQQVVSIGPGCVQIGIVMHELMHAVGFFHEQSRTDRDQYINIIWNNILPGMNGQFMKYSLNEIQFLGTGYDYGSIMHYGPRDFSINMLPTIVPRQPGKEIGQRRGFSATDIIKLNRLNQCAGTTGGGGTGGTKVDCKDNFGNCPQMKSDGGCKVDWVKQRCKKTCEICGTRKKPVCVDKNGYCDYWTGQGYCTNWVHQRYMQLYCKKSCGTC